MANIADFKAQMIGGGARPNQFYVQLTFPSYVGLGVVAGQKRTANRRCAVYRKNGFACRVGNDRRVRGGSSGERSSLTHALRVRSVFSPPSMGRHRV